MTRHRIDLCLRALGAVGARLTAALPVALPALLAVTAALAAPSPADPSPPAGYVDGSAFAKFATEDAELIEVNVSGRVLRALAGSMGTDGDPDAKKFGEMLGGLHSIRAIVTQLDPARVADAGKLIESVAADLVRKGWEEIAKVRKKNEKIRVLGLPVGDKFGGLTVMLVDDDDDGTGKQLIFANIAGPFDLSQLSSLEGSLNIPGLDKFDDEGEEDAAPTKDPKGAKGAK